MFVLCVVSKDKMQDNPDKKQYECSTKNSAGDMDVISLFVYCVGRGLCGRPITLPGEFYLMLVCHCVITCKNNLLRLQWLERRGSTKGKRFCN